MAERLLKSFSMRNITHAFGRSILDFRSFSPVLSRPRSIPPLNLQGRLHPTNTPIELSQNEVSFCWHQYVFENDQCKLYI